MNQGANWSSFAVNAAEERRDAATYHRFKEIAKSNPEFMTTTEFVYVADEDLFGVHWFKDMTPNVGLTFILYKSLQPGTPSPSIARVTFTASLAEISPT